MVKLTRRLAVYVGSLFVLIAVYTLAYRWGMATFEAETRTWYQSLEFVVQSMTTTGYGQDAPWETREMTALVLLIQVTGIAYIVVAIPRFVVPWIETLVEPTPPETIDRIEDHVVVVGYTSLCDTLVDELETSDVPYVVLEADGERAQRLHEDSLVVLHGDPTDDGLEAAQVDDARAVVVDATEREFVDATLALEEYDADATALVLVTDPTRARYFRYVGVDEVLSPKHRLGKALGDRVRTVVEPTAEGDFTLGDGIDLVEFSIDPETDLFGGPVAEARRLEETGATVVGAWVRGDFVTELSDHDHVDRNTSVLVAGTDSALEAAAEATGTSGSSYRTTEEPVVVVGAGLVGRTAAGTLSRAGLEISVVDREDDDIVDVVGDATDEETLLEAGIEDAGTIVIALETDDDAILTTLTASALHPEIEIVVGANTAASTRALWTAGADYVLALPNVAGRMIVQRTFEREVMALNDRLQLRQYSGSAIAGTDISTAEIRRETGCFLLGIGRDDEYRSTAGGVDIHGDESVVVAGTERQLDRFEDSYVSD